MTYGYIRVSTIDQDVKKFEYEILNYANSKRLGSVEFVSEKQSGTRDWKNRKLGELLSNCTLGDVIIVPELSRLARSIGKIYEIIQHCQDKNIELHVLKQNLIIQGKPDLTTKIMISTFAMVAEIERDFISMRTKEALAAKKRDGKTLGRPKGIGKSKLDDVLEDIIMHLSNGSTQRFLAKKYSTTPANMNRFLRLRNIDQEALKQGLTTPERVIEEVKRTVKNV